MSFAAMDTIPGRVRRRSEVPVPAGYAVFDCETTGTSPGHDEIVSLAIVRLDADGGEVGRYAGLVRPSCPIPTQTTAVHGTSDSDVLDAPTLAGVAPELLRHEIALHAHDALGDALATAALLRLVLAAGLAPETAELDQAALWRLRSRGDARPATEAQIRRVFALGHAAGVGRAALLALVARIAGTDDVDSLTREQVQDVYDALEQPTPAPIERAA